MDDFLEKELILENSRSISLDRDLAKLKKEFFLLKEEMKNKDIKLDDKDRDILFLKREVYHLQEIDKDLTIELNQSLVEIEYWYALNSPTFKTVITKYLRSLKDAYNNFKRPKDVIWSN